MVVLIAVVTALALAGSVPPVLVAAGWVAATHPPLALLVAAGYAVLMWRRRRKDRPGPDDEAALLRTLAAELAAGASLRSALVAAVARTPRLPLGPAGRAAEAGLPASTVAVRLRAGLPLNGRVVAAAWLLAAESGGPAVGLMSALAVRAAREGELARERGALTAQARASAVVVAGLPGLLLGGMAISGRLTVGDDPVLAVVLVVGLALQAAGLGVVVAMVRRAGR